MLDIRWIRDNPEALAEALEKRGWSSADARAEVDAVVAADEARRAHLTELQAKQERRNAASKEIGKAMAQKDLALAEKLKAEVADIKRFVQDGEAEERTLDKALFDRLAALPNLPHDDVPVGADEADNVEIRRVGEPKRANAAKEHFEIGEALGLMDFETAAKLSGSRFTVLKGQLARLERAPRPVHARPAHHRARLSGGPAAASGTRRADVRHRAIAEIHRRSFPDLAGGRGVFRRKRVLRRGGG